MPSFLFAKIILASLLSAWTFVLCLLLAYKFTISNKPIHKSIKILATTALLCICISESINAIGLYHNDWKIDDGQFNNILLFIYTIFWTSGFIASYLFLIALVYFSFRDSFYEIPNGIMIIHTIIAVFLFFAIAASIYLQWIEKYVYFTAILILCEMIIYILGLFHLGYILNHQLLLLLILNDDPLSK